MGDEQEYNKTEITRITPGIEECKKILKKMYLDQVNNVLNYDMWINLKNEYEVKLNRLSAEYQKHLYANTNFLDTGLKILDLCRKASFPAIELSAEEVANIIRETYLSATAKDKRVKVVFKEPFAAIENLVKLAKREIAEVGFVEFKSAKFLQRMNVSKALKKSH